MADWYDKVREIDKEFMKENMEKLGFSPKKNIMCVPVISVAGH
jgi:hypothetical protein